MAKGLKVYWAAGLHRWSIQQLNEQMAKRLEDAGQIVLLPQRHGIWEPMIKERMALDSDLSYEDALNLVKMHCYEMDMRDMIAADACVMFCADKPPAEGAVFELTYITEKDKPGCMFVPDDKVWAEINLMLTQRFIRCRTIEGVIEFLDEVAN